jgi:hypothetical protein
LEVTVRILLVIFVLGITAAAPATSAPDESFYWSSDKATVALTDSDWATNHGIASASCYGRGAVKTDEIGQPTFALFRCALRSRKYSLVAHVTLTPTGPETFALSQLKGRPKTCR